MAKYIFTKPYNISGPTSGCVAGGNCPPPQIIFSANIGDCVEGRASTVTGKDGTVFNIIYIKASDGLEYGVDTPEYIKPLENDKCNFINKDTTSNFFTPKNIIIGILAIVVIVGGLKLAKVF